MYNTGNAIPSAALEDMADNANVLDQMVNKTEGIVIDRTGLERRVFQQIIMDMGFEPLTGSFQTGATLTQRNQVLQDETTGVFYSWNGVIPVGGKIIPVGSTPATSGGIGASAWVDRTDLTLRSEMKKISGVSYSQYGAVLDGSTDDTVAVMACHADANSNGYKVVQNGGVAKISGTQQIEIKTDVEYSGGFYFLTDTIQNDLFLISPEYASVNLTVDDVTISEFSKYAMRIPSLALYKNHALFLVSSLETDLIRTNGDPQRKRCVSVVNRNGDLRYPLTTTFSTFDKCMLTPVNINQRTVKGFSIKYTGSEELRSPIKITRNRVKLIDPRYIDASGANIPIQNFIALEFVYDVEIDAGTGDPIGADRVANSYFVNYWTSAKVKISGLTYDTGWAGTDGNYSRDITHENCSADRIGGHFSCWDFTFNNITTSRSRGIEISGGGKLSVTDLKIKLNSAYTPFTAVEIRGDYAAEWDGDIDIQGVSVDATSLTDLSPNPTVTILSAITDSSVGSHEFGRATRLPKSIKIDDVEVLMNEAATGGRLLLRGAVTGHLTGISNNTKYPDKISVSSVNIIDGSNSIANAVNAVTVFGSVKPSSAKQEIKIFIDNCSNKDPRFYGSNPSTSGDDTVFITGGTNQVYKLKITDSDWVRYNVQTNFGSECMSVNSRFSYLNGLSADFIYTTGCKFGSCRTEGSFSLFMDGGYLETFLNVDGITYGVFGYPNDLNVNLRYAKGVACLPNSGVQGGVVTKDLLQLGYYQGAYVTAFSDYLTGALAPSGSVTPRWIGDKYLDTTSGQFEWYISTGVTNTSWKILTLQTGSLLRTGSASPIGSVTPRFVGEDYLDTTSGQFVWYKSTGLVNTNWKQISN